MRVVFIGSGAFGVPALEALAASAHQVSLVVTQPDRPAGRKQTLTPCPAAAAARRLELPLYQPERINRPAARERLAREDADVFVVVSYGQILKPKVLALPRLGCLNIHASLLPRHRGASPIQGAILAGDEVTGVTIMKMDEGLDTGPMLARREVPVAPDDTAGSLHDRLAEAAPGLLLETLEGLEEGRIEAEEQDDRAATVCPIIEKREGLVRWDLPAVDLERRVRAFSPWPGAYTFFTAPASGRRLRLVIERAEVVPDLRGEAGRVLEATPGGVVVGTGKGALRILRMKPEGRTSQEAAEFLRGYPLRPGDRLGMEDEPRGGR